LRAIARFVTGMREPGEEHFDVVDERDDVIGRAPRREVHARGLRHRAIHVLVFDRAGKLFLQKRSMIKDIAPGLWDSSCSGHLDAGEDYDAAARRELAEEIGVVIDKPPARWFRIGACSETGWEFVWVYRLWFDGPLVLNPEEIEMGEWFRPEAITLRLEETPHHFAASFRHLWKLRPD